MNVHMVPLSPMARWPDNSLADNPAILRLAHHINDVVPITKKFKRITHNTWQSNGFGWLHAYRKAPSGSCCPFWVKSSEKGFTKNGWYSYCNMVGIRVAGTGWNIRVTNNLRRHRSVLWHSVPPKRPMVWAAIGMLTFPCHDIPGTFPRHQIGRPHDIIGQ